MGGGTSLGLALSVREGGSGGVGGGGKTCGVVLAYGLDCQHVNCQLPFGHG